MEENDLIQAAREGDTNAFRAMFDAHNGRVFSLAYRYLRNQADAEDILQETFIRAHSALHSYDPAKCPNFSVWINRICINCSIDALRRARHRDAHSLDHEAMSTLAANAPKDNPERVARNREVRERIRQALERLSPRQRTVFTMRHDLGHTTREIAQSLGSTEGSVRKHLFRAVEILRKRLRRYALEDGYEV